MQAIHKDILQVNRTNLVREMQDIKTIAYALEEKRIITYHMLEEILAESTNTDKKRELLSILPRRGEEAFDAFYDILVDNREGSAADILKPELASERKMREKETRDAARRSDPPPPSGYIAHGGIAPSDYDELPERWPDEKLIKEDVQVITCDDAGPMFEEFQKSRVGSGNSYKHESSPRGIALLINNDKFSEARKNGCNLEDRDGTGKDLDGVHALLTQLNYNVQIEENLTAEDIKKCLDGIKKTEHTRFDSFLLFLLSHGEKESIYGTDGKLLLKDYFIQSFNGENCPSLSGKPKLFFFQACQGAKKDAGVPVAAGVQSNTGSTSSSEPDDLEVSLRKMQKLKIKSDTVADVKKENAIAVEGDVFIASATIPDYLSWRNTRNGTWFVQAVIYIFKKFSYKENITGLMTKVNHLVSKGRTDSGFMQVSSYESRLSRQFYFFPGLPESGSLSGIQATS